MVSKDADTSMASRLAIDSAPSNFSSYLAPIKKYLLEWNDLSTVCEDARLVHLRQIACAGHLKVAKFRSICWAVLLDVLRGDQHDWLQQRRVHRAMYVHIKRKWHTNPHAEAEAEAEQQQPVATDDPLSQSQGSAWNRHFCDQELIAVIRQDVVRTFPGVDFYRRERVQQLMTSVLFCYAREHPHMCYRQGMHEILAPVLYVLHGDQLTLAELAAEEATVAMEEREMGGSWRVLCEIMDPECMEEDAYFIFMKIMSSIESFYHIRDMRPTASGHFPPVQQTPPPTTSSSTSAPASDMRSKLEVVGQLNYIRDRILARVDPQLCKHLQGLDIPLTLFGIRWLRLLFGREFSLPDLLRLWDAIFADGNHFALTNYVVVAMLVHIRQTLLTGDYTTCLTHLMKYPGNVDITHIIRYAMHIHSPQMHQLPVGAFVPQTFSRNPTATQAAAKLSQTVPAGSALPRQLSGQAAADSGQHRRALSNVERRSRTVSTASSGSGGQGQGSTSAAVAATAEEHLKAHLRTIQNTTALAAMRMTAHTQAMRSTGELQSDTSIVEGFRENSPEALRLELESARAVMSITRFKLAQYLAVFRQQIPATADSLQQAMTGLEELCSLLEYKPSLLTDYAMASGPVERAFEATNEPATSSGRAARSTQSIDKIVIQSPADNGLTAAPATTTGEENGEDVVFETTILQRRESLNLNSRYEIPDDGRRISRKASRILGDRKEVEMHEFQTCGGDGSFDSTVVSPVLPDVDPPGERGSPVN